MRMSVNRLIPLVLAAAALTWPSRATASDPERCLSCHGYPNLVRVDADGTYQSFSVDDERFSRSVHRQVACTDCHTGIDHLPHDGPVSRVDCATTCHVLEPFTQRRYSHQRIVRQFAESRHARGQGSEALESLKPTCTYCHENEVVHTFTSYVSDPAEVLARCVRCHEQDSVAAVYDHMLHRQVKRHTMDPKKIVRICVDCHRDKERMSRFAVSDKALVAVETYEKNVHSLMVAAGSERAATCIDCHTAHEVRKATDPSSVIYRGPGKVASAVMPDAALRPSIQPCGRSDCHADANEQFARIEQHPLHSLRGDPAGRLTEEFFFWLTTSTLFGLLCIVLLEAITDPIRAIKRHRTGEVRAPRGNGRPWMSRGHRIEHAVLMVSFILLCLTGLSLRFSGASFAATLYAWFGGPEVAPWVHRITGVIMCTLFVQHSVGLIRTMLRERKWPWQFAIFPQVQDARDLFEHLRFLLGRRPERPPGGHFTWKNKFDYFAVYWGMPVFGLSGVVLWNPEWFARVLPPVSVRIALIAHSDEALLAASVIVIWHMWNVHLRPLVFPVQWTFWNGLKDERLVQLEHGLVDAHEGEEDEG